jgi:hypothetical protein
LRLYTIFTVMAAIKTVPSAVGDGCSSFVSLQLALSPVMWLPNRIEFANMVAVQRPHDADPREPWHLPISHLGFLA